MSPIQPGHVSKKTVDNRLARWRKADRQRLAELVNKYGAICWYCSSKLPYSKQQSIDHLVSLSYLARQVNPPRIRPIALACHICNSAKGNRSVEEFNTWLKHVRSSKFQNLVENPPTPSIFQRVLMSLSFHLTRLGIFNIIV